MAGPMKNPGWSRQRADEKLVDDVPRGGDLRLALAYANTYHLGMSSLALQRVFELVESRPRWRCERFFLDGEGMPLSVEADRRLSDFGCIAFSVSFEGDFVNLVRMLDRASVPSRRRARSDRDPLIVMGGACAAINPLPMSEIVDVFALGAAENTLPALLECLESETSRCAALERLGSTPGFFVPEHHDPERAGLVEKLRKLELTAEQMKTPGHLPTTEFRFLIQIRDKITETHLAIREIRDIKTQVKSLEKRLKEDANAKEALEVGKALVKSLTGIEETLYQTKSKSRQDPLNYPIRLNNRLTALVGVVAAGDNRPTAQARAVYAELAQGIDAEISKLRQVISTNLMTFNDKLRARGTPAVHVKAVEAAAKRNQ